jgi:uncharacterized delta-60 repeat protein
MTLAMRPRSPVFLALACLLVMLPAGRARAAPGDLDATFGGDGKVVTNFGKGIDAPEDVAIQANGKIVAVGRASTRRGSVRFALARYRTNGSLDPTFGGDGLVIINFAGRSNAAFGVAIQSDGRIVAVGDVEVTARVHRFAVARFDRDGTLDPTFGGNGKVTTGFTGGDDGARDVAIQADGRIVVVGSTDLGEFALARYEIDGMLDLTFDGDGRVTTALTSTGLDSANGVAIDADQRIVVAGTGGNGSFALARYDSLGTLDATFDGDGKVRTNFTGGFDTADAVAIQDDGKIVVAGEAGFLGEWTGDFGLARYESDGTLDAMFDGDGKVITRFTRDDDSASDVAIQANGKIVAAGSAGYNGAAARFALARYRWNGSLDSSFGRDGRATTRFSKGFDFARGLAIQPDGKIVVAGSTFAEIDGIDAKFALARYLGGASLAAGVNSRYSSNGMHQPSSESPWTGGGAQEAGRHPPVWSGSSG